MPAPVLAPETVVGPMESERMRLVIGPTPIEESMMKQTKYECLFLAKTNQEVSDQFTADASMLEPKCQTHFGYQEKTKLVTLQINNSQCLFWYDAQFSGPDTPVVIG